MEEVLFSEGLANWNAMYEEVDDEGGRMRSNIYWNLVCGNARLENPVGPREETRPSGIDQPNEFRPRSGMHTIEPL